jgi:hypothetical protein
MVSDVYLIYNDDTQLKKVKNYPFDNSYFFHFIDDRTRQGRKDAWKIKGGFSAKLSPFAVCYDKNRPIKAFYTEADSNIIESLIDFLK